MRKLVRGLVLVLAVLGIAAASACSSAKSDSSFLPDAGSRMGSNVKGIAENAAQRSSGTANSASAAAGASSSTNLPAPDSRKIIQSASISLSTTEYDKSVAALQDTVESYGAVVQNSVVQGSGTSGIRSASYTVRVPTTKFKSFIDSVGKVGKVLSVDVKGQDVTENYMDTQTRLTALRTEQSRLLELLAKASKMSDIIEIEDKLTAVETQIEQYTGELKKWDSLIDLSTVDISLSEVPKGTIAVPDTFTGKLGSILIQSVNALILTLKTVCYVIVAVLPFAVAAGAIAAIVILLRRKTRRRKEKMPDGGKGDGEDAGKDGEDEDENKDGLS